MTDRTLDDATLERLRLPPKPCVKCEKRARVRLMKYCRNCRDTIVKALLAAGYLTPLPWRSQHRDSGAREHQIETRRGKEQG